MEITKAQIKASDDKMFQEIKDDLDKRMSTHVNSMCASADEVRIAWLVCQVESLKANEVPALPPKTDREQLEDMLDNINEDYDNRVDAISLQIEVNPNRYTLVVFHFNKDGKLTNISN